MIEKSPFHPRNKHQGHYNFEALIKANKNLAEYVRPNGYLEYSIDFANSKAVIALNQALLQYYYDIKEWKIPAHYLCPPIPGRADYLHYMADLLAESNNGIIPGGKNIKVLDIGVGANVIYPLIGQREYGWDFIGTDIDPLAIANAAEILHVNGITEVIKLRLQTLANSIFNGIVLEGDTFDFTMCNPPFHASMEAAQNGTKRKWNNLDKNSLSPRKILPQNRSVKLNFGGQCAELYCEGGELAFVNQMIKESILYQKRCLWFTTLISKATNLPLIYRTLKKANVHKVKTIDMAQGQKKSRVVAWTFLNEDQHRIWRNNQAFKSLNLT